MAAAMGQLDKWQTIVDLIPESKLDTAEQRAKLGSMQLQMILGVKAMEAKKDKKSKAEPQSPSLSQSAAKEPAPNVSGSDHNVSALFASSMDAPD